MVKFLHGGDLSNIKAAYPQLSKSWIDLSTGINPIPYPWYSTIAENELVTASKKLPQQDDINECHKIWTNYLNAKDPEEWLMLSGSQAIINITPRLFPERTCYIPQPSYNEHERTWLASNQDYSLIERDQIERVISQPNGVLILTNPNNPDGFIWRKKQLYHFADSLSRNNGYLIVDEAFADLDPGISLAADDLPDNIILLRSFGKFFGLAGLRLGVARLPGTLYEKAKQYIGPWSVNAVGLLIAKYAFQDENWILETKTRLADDSKILSRILVQTGFGIVGGTELYQFVKHDNVSLVNDKLNQNGIFVRIFDNDVNKMRFGLPKNNNEFSRLKDALL